MNVKVFQVAPGVEYEADLSIFLGSVCFFKPIYYPVFLLQEYTHDAICQHVDVRFEHNFDNWGSSTAGSHDHYTATSRLTSNKDFKPNTPSNT